tara:strand:+ start:3546 stop:4400 length:855 start_codon:yes stop_codon:yes gene_type:complete
MEMHELDMRESSLPYFHHNLKSMLAESGFAILRGAVSEARIACYHQMLDDTYDRLNQYVKNEGVAIAPEDYAKPYNGKGGAHEIAFRLNLGQIPDKFFTVANPGFSMYDVIGDMRFGVLLMNFFQRPYFPSPAGHARRVSFDEEDEYKNFAGAIRLHVDATHHTPHQFGLNFWTPLGPCGETAPGLQLLAVGYKEVLDFLKVDFGKSPRSKDDVYINQERISALEYNTFENFDEDLLYRPRMNAGDVLLFHNWSIHGTYKTPEMTQKRTSLELRVNCNSFTFPR